MQCTLCTSPTHLTVTLLGNFAGLRKLLVTCVGEGHKAAKLRVKQQQVAGVAKVIGISKLKSKYEPFEAKRQLCNSYDLFVADDRIVPSLPKLIGACRLTPSIAISCYHHCTCTYWPLPTNLAGLCLKYGLTK